MLSSKPSGAPVMNGLKPLAAHLVISRNVGTSIFFSHFNAEAEAKKNTHKNKNPRAILVGEAAALKWRTRIGASRVSDRMPSLSRQLPRALAAFGRRLAAFLGDA